MTMLSRWIGEKSMRNVALISCTKSKRTGTHPARLLYDKSPKFRKSLLYAQLISNETFVLSAKHGLLSLDDVIESYDETLIGKSKAIKELWGYGVAEQIEQIFDINKTIFYIIAGKDYFEPLVKHIQYYELPLRGVNMFQWSARLDDLISKAREVSL